MLEGASFDWLDHRDMDKEQLADFLAATMPGVLRVTQVSQG